jgi:hypothetical protein
VLRNLGASRSKETADFQYTYRWQPSVEGSTPGRFDEARALLPICSEQIVLVHVLVSKHISTRQAGVVMGHGGPVV